VGLFSDLLGRNKVLAPKLDGIFALPSAAIGLEAAAGFKATGHAGICIKAPDVADLRTALDEAKELIAVSPATDAYSEVTDSYGYQWILLGDSDLGELVTRVHSVNSSLDDAGFGNTLLCSVFSLRDASGKAVFLIYSLKRGSFYPFAPLDGERRDNELELRLNGLLGADLPMEADLSRWFPIYDCPVASEA